MRRRLAILFTAAAAAVPTFFVLQPADAGQLCYDIQINVAGNEVPPQQGCQDIPDLALP